MKYLFLFIFSGTLMIACNTNDKKASMHQTITDSVVQKAMSDSANYTSIQWIDSTTQDLGKINEGQMVEISWRFKNAGEKPLIIANVTPGCGCTLAEKPEEPIAVGKEGVIKARFDSRGQSGQHSKYVTVRANTKDGVSTLTFRVDVTKA